MTISEADLTKSLGLSRHWLSKLRKKHLTASTDFFYDQEAGNTVMITEQGQTKLREILNLSSAVKSEEHSPANAVTHGPPAAQLLTISRLCLNPRLLEATNSTGQITNVLVRNNQLYRLSDPILVIPSPTVPNHFQATGPTPRFKGDPLYRRQLQNLS